MPAPLSRHAAMTLVLQDPLPRKQSHERQKLAKRHKAEQKVTDEFAAQRHRNPS